MAEELGRIVKNSQILQVIFFVQLRIQSISLRGCDRIKKIGPVMTTSTSFRNIHIVAEKKRRIHPANRIPTYTRNTKKKHNKTHKMKQRMSSKENLAIIKTHRQATTPKSHNHFTKKSNRRYECPCRQDNIPLIAAYYWFFYLAFPIERCYRSWCYVITVITRCSGVCTEVLRNFWCRHSDWLFGRTTCKKRVPLSRQFLKQRLGNHGAFSVRFGFHFAGFDEIGFLFWNPGLKVARLRFY